MRRFAKKKKQQEELRFNKLFVVVKTFEFNLIDTTARLYFDERFD